MQEMEIMEILGKTGAYKTGHFKLSSGLHSGAYMQCALVMQDPIIAERLCGALARKFADKKPDVVIGPAMGGIIFAYELARALGAKAMFAERDKEGKMSLRRGFLVTPDTKVLIAEDVLTTGRSIKEVMELLKKDSVKPIGIGCIVDRRAIPIDVGGVRIESLIKREIPVFEENKCPLCKEGIPIRKPGSRKEDDTSGRDALGGLV